MKEIVLPYSQDPGFLLQAAQHVTALTFNHQSIAVSGNGLSVMVSGRLWAKQTLTVV